jgi:homoserine O-succinyltransferase
MNWAEENTASTILSCLAAHAGALHTDGIGRSPLGNKRFGVFEHQLVNAHPLTEGIAEPVCIPHSRWNELREDGLRSSGYDVLTKSPEAGVDLFVKQKRQSLFVHFQGHPEYAGQTLLKEYRRDVKRYLRQERDSYPLLPHGYFDSVATRLLTEFQTRALSDRREELIESFPDSDLVGTLQTRWRGSATSIYRNWLQYLLNKDVEKPSVPVTAKIGCS